MNKQAGSSPLLSPALTTFQAASGIICIENRIIGYSFNLTRGVEWWITGGGGGGG